MVRGDSGSGGTGNGSTELTVKRKRSDSVSQSVSVPLASSTVALSPADIRILVNKFLSTDRFQSLLPQGYQFIEETRKYFFDFANSIEKMDSAATEGVRSGGAGLGDFSDRLEVVSTGAVGRSSAEMNIDRNSGFQKNNKNSAKVKVEKTSVLSGSTASSSGSLSSSGNSNSARDKRKGSGKVSAAGTNSDNSAGGKASNATETAETKGTESFSSYMSALGGGLGESGGGSMKIESVDELRMRLRSMSKQEKAEWQRLSRC